MINNIQEIIKYVREELHLGIKEIDEGEKLIIRLIEVDTCFKKLLSTLQPKAEITDVVAEYQNATSVLEELNTLDVQHVKRIELENFIGTLKERAEYLLTIRQSIESRDHVVMEESLKIGDALESKYGVFCREEMETCRKFVVEIHREFEVIDKIIIIVSNFCKMNMDDSNAPSKTDTQISFKEVSKELNILKNEYIAVSSCSKYVYSTVNAMYSLRIEYFKGDWEKMLSHGQVLTLNLKIIKDTISAKDNNSMPVEFVKRLETFVPFFEREIEFVQESIDMNVTLPICTKAFAGAEDYQQREAVERGS